jgi:hypothetical protein
VQGEPAPEGALGLAIDATIAELLDDQVEPVDLRDGPIPVEDDCVLRNGT